jgi:hypothetical protein
MFVKNCLNMVSVPALNKSSISTTFSQGIFFLVNEDDQAQIGFGLLKDDEIPTLVGREAMTEYKANETVKAIMAVADTEKKSQQKCLASRVDLWHQRLGHANWKSVKFMLHHNTADNMDSV